LRPESMIVASQRVRRVVESERLKGFRLEVVTLVDTQ
jgi:hypothetical protein